MNLSVALQVGLKLLLTSSLILAASEVAKRSAWLGAILISLPLSSILALSLLWIETEDPQKVIDLSKGIAFLVLPSMAFFGILIGLLKFGHSYWVSLFGSIACMALVFFLYSKVMKAFGWV
jgi:hypothetical protein